MALAMLGLLACNANSSPPSDANTNWLGPCSEHADCTAGDACICGLCTRACETDEQCARGGAAASCVSPAAEDAENGCSEVVRGAGVRICLAGCRSDADCETDARCLEGACWPRMPAIVSVPDAGPAQDAGRDGGPEAIGRRLPAGTPATVPRGIDAGADLSQVDASFDFDAPVETPEPELAIEATADAPSLIGVWVEQSGGGQVMKLRLEIFARPGGEGVGSVIAECPGCPLSGPIAPASDPDLGYPVELGVSDQGRLRTNLLPEFPYRMFDGRADADAFRFWFTNNDLWRDWCALQTPYLIEVEGRSQYSCIPQAFAHDLIPPADNDAKKWLCAYDNSVCRCDEHACAVSPYGSVHTLDLRFEGEALVGLWSTGDLAGETAQVRFLRIAGDAR